MKTFYTCFVVALLAVTGVKSDAIQDSMKKVAKECLQEVPITPEDIHILATDPQKASDAAKCHIKCIMEKQDILKNGIFNYEAYLKSVNTYPSFKKRPDEVIHAGEECKKEKGSNDCETAFKITMCLKDHKAAVFDDE